MKITFRIHYNTQWGEQVAVTGPVPELGNGDPTRAFRLNHIGDGHWEKTLEWKGAAKAFEYRYILINDQSDVLNEDWGSPRTVQLPAKKQSSLILQDTWRANRHAGNTYYTSAFQDVIFKPGHFKAKPVRSASEKVTLRFQLHAPRVDPGCQICVLGNIPELGNWDLKNPLLLGDEAYPLWSGSINWQPSCAIAYKYGMYDPKEKKVKLLEAGSNRLLLREIIPGTADRFVITDEYFKHPAGNWKGAGVAIPVFSLRSSDGLGVGEFTDIKSMVDWASEMNMKMVQILPVNDTSATHTWKDSYPYAAISVFALHPLYLNIASLEGFNKAVPGKEYDEKRKELNAKDVVDFEEVMKLKRAYARKIFSLQRTKFLESADFRQFMQENEHWLKPYALFCTYRDQYGTSNFNHWKKDSAFSAKKLKEGTDPAVAHFDEVAFHYYLQFHLDRQLREAADYARSHGIVLKGDIPIGIYRHSVDAWTEPRLYNMDAQSGAPPDDFSETGQNWGFPTYNWEEMAKDGYQWWQNRLKQLSRYFDAFRIDHILGFFRIWQIPVEQVEGTMGFFNKAIPIDRNEFAERGIWFDQDRYCLPYLTVPLLNEKFGEEALYVSQTFLERDASGNFLFKEDFNTQRKIQAFLKDPGNKDKAHLQDSLFQLISNVLFFEVPGSDGQQFHPRIDFPKTTSFKALGKDTRDKLNELYIDYFYHRQDEFWRAQAMEKLPAIKHATNMLICGEDLGMVPHCVPDVMKELEILTLEIQRMSKNPETEFLQEKDIPYLSVISPSTHDMSPLRLWWKEMKPDQRMRYYQNELKFKGIPPVECETYVAERIIEQHLSWPGMWTVFSIQDLLALSKKLRRKDPSEERINIPANPEHYWRYRIHVSMEDLLKEADFTEKLERMMREAPVI